MQGWEDDLRVFFMYSRIVRIRCPGDRDSVRRVWSTEVCFKCNETALNLRVTWVK